MYKTTSIVGYHHYHHHYHQGHHHHQGMSHSLWRNPPYCLHRTRSWARRGQVDPRWRVRSRHLVLARPRDLLHYLRAHSVALIVHLLSMSLATCPDHPCLFRLIVVTMSSIPVCWRIQVLRFRSLRVMPRMMRSIMCWFTCREHFLHGVVQCPGLTSVCHHG